MKLRRDLKYQMLIKINHKEHLITCWLNQSESEDVLLNVHLKLLAQENKKNGYFTAVFVSGKNDVEDAIYMLLSNANKTQRRCNQDG